MTSSASCANPQVANSAVVTISCITTAVTDINGLETFSVSPNPTNGLINVKIRLTQLKSVSFKVIDALGKETYVSLPQNISGTVTKQINIGSASGIYYLKTSFGNQVLISKIIVVR
jgi:hypothetical protein